MHMHILHVSIWKSYSKQFKLTGSHSQVNFTLTFPTLSAQSQQEERYGVGPTRRPTENSTKQPGKQQTVPEALPRNP